MHLAQHVTTREASLTSEKKTMLHSSKELVLPRKPVLRTRAGAQ